MLKIKDNVDLKELEKYGYKKGEDMCNVSFSCYGKEFDKQLDKILTINILKPLYIVEIDKKNKKIELLITKEYSSSAISYNENNIIEPYIQDLIKADLVEKVE